MVEVPSVEIKYGGSVLTWETGTILDAFLRSSAYGGSSFGVLAKMPWTDKLDFLVKSSEKKELDVRFRLDRPNKTISTPWVKMISSSPVFQHDPSVITLEFGGTGKGRHAFHQQRRKAYIDKTASDIVEELADEHDLEADVQDTKPKGDFYQCGCSDWEFVTAELVPFQTASSRSDFYFFVRNGDTVVYKHPDYNKPPKQTFVYGKAGSKQTFVWNSALDYDLESTLLSGALASSTMGYDPFNKVPFEFEQNDSKVSLPQPEDATVKPLQPEDPKTLFVVTPNNENEKYSSMIENMGKALWTSGANKLFRLTVMTRPLVDLNLLDNVAVELLDLDGELHFLGGGYVVYEIEHRITPDEGWYTLCSLERRYHLDSS